MGDKIITISEKDFADKASTVAGEFIKSARDVLMFNAFCGQLHKALFNDEEPFKAGDEVFVISDKGDANCFVNQIVTVIEVIDDVCYVTNGDKQQTIYFKNLRKVVN